MDPTIISELRKALEQNSAHVKACRDILLAFDDGPRACTGVMSKGELVWKGSFIALMEQLRDSLPPESDT